MKRSLFGKLLFLLSPDAAAGGASAAAAAPGLSVTGDTDLDSAVMNRLGVAMEEPSSKIQTPNPKADAGAATETPEQKAEREAAEAKAKNEDGKTPEEIAAAETAAQERETKVTALVESGKTPEEAEAEIVAEEEAAAAAAVQTPELTPEIQTWHEAQIAAKDEELATFKQQAEEATAKVTELQAQVDAASTQPVAIAPIDPLFLIDDPAKLDAEATKLRSFEGWLMKNWDGVAAVEASADGKVAAHPGYTAEEIRERYQQVKELRETILPAARQGIQVRKANEAQARKAYPELFDAKRPEFKVAENLLKLAPGLKAVVPNIHIVIGDALRGEKVRLAEEKARASKAKPAGKVIPPKPVKPGAAAGATGARPATKVASKNDVLDTDKFSKVMDAGGTGRAALVAALS